MRKKMTVLGIHAPGPRATPWAALLMALALSAAFVAALLLWRLVAAVL